MITPRLDSAQAALEELAAALPSEEFALVLTLDPDAPARLAVTSRSYPSRSVEVVVLNAYDGAAFVAVSGGGSMRISDAHCSRGAAELITWTLIGR